MHTPHYAMCCRIVVRVLMVLSLMGAGAVLPPPTLQEIQVAGHVLHFQQTHPSGAITVALVYNTADPRSREEAAALAALLGTGLAIGDLILRPLLVEQAQLSTSVGLGAVFATVGVDEGLLAAGLKKHQVLCLTRHLEQVEHGVCTVAIRSSPSVSIVFNAMNAAAAGVEFATAFRMMVREI